VKRPGYCQLSGASFSQQNENKASGLGPGSIDQQKMTQRQERFTTVRTISA